MNMKVLEASQSLSRRARFKRAFGFQSAERGVGKAGQRGFLISALVLSDALMLSLALLWSRYFLIRTGLITSVDPADLPRLYIGTAASVSVMLTIFALSKMYQYDLLLGGPQEYAAVLRACTYGLVALVFVSFLQPAAPLSRAWLILAWAMTILLVGGGRFIMRRVFQRLRAKLGWYVLSTLIVGANEHGRALARQLTGPNTGVLIMGFLDDFLPEGSPVTGSLRVLGTPRELSEVARHHGAEQVIVVPNAVAWESFDEVIRASGRKNGYKLRLSPGFYEIMTTGVQVIQKEFVPLLTLEQARITGLDLVLKSALDFGLGAVLFLLTLPLNVLIGLAIGLEQGLPVLERHLVLGLRGESFRTLKFRTSNSTFTCRKFGIADIEGTPKGHQIPSVLGGFLYRTGLDKLPQLIDVIRGRMSLVGPRTVSYIQEAAHQPWLPNLLTVKPGWTGPWAVGDADGIEEEMRLATFYIRNWTIWIDLHLLFQAAKMSVFRSSRPDQLRRS